MQAIMANTRGLSVLAGVGLDRVLGLVAVTGALLAGGWLCMVVLAIG